MHRRVHDAGLVGLPPCPPPSDCPPDCPPPPDWAEAPAGTSDPTACAVGTGQGAVGTGQGDADTGQGDAGAGRGAADVFGRFDFEGALFAAFPLDVWLDGSAERAVRAEARRLFGGAALTPFRASVALSSVHGALVMRMGAARRRQWCREAWRERAERLRARGVRPAPVPRAYR